MQSKNDNVAARDNSIQMYCHCKQCMDELRNGEWQKHVSRKQIAQGMSPREYAQLEAGWTELGLQVRCVRHDNNIVHIDLKGQKVRLL